MKGPPEKTGDGAEGSSGSGGSSTAAGALRDFRTVRLEAAVGVDGGRAAPRRRSTLGEEPLELAVRAAQFGERDGDLRPRDPDGQRLAANLADDGERDPLGQLAQRLARPRDDEAAGALAEQAGRRVLAGAEREVERRPPPAPQAALRDRDEHAAPGDVGAARPDPSPPARQHSATATSTPPSAMSWQLVRTPDRTASRIASMPARTVRTSTSGSASGSGSPHSLASSLAASEGWNSPAIATASPARANASRPAARASGRRPTMPITGVG